MSKPQIYTYVDAETLEPTTGLVVSFGPLPKGVDVEPNKLFMFESFSSDEKQRFEDMPAESFRDGVTMLVDSSVYSSNASFINEIQLRVAFIYCKFVHYPSLAQNIPDPLQVRSHNLPNVFGEIARAENTRFYLRFPMADKLERGRLGLPVLLLLPGPSLHRLDGMLPAIREKCLVVCIARSLQFCLDQGVLPDFVIQFDSNPVQRYFYPPDTDFSRTYLIAMSGARIGEFASSFRGVFFMDSFAQQIRPNAYRMRESWLSTNIACLGLAEALHSQEIYLAGADLSFASAKTPYITSEQHHTESGSESCTPIPIDFNNDFPMLLDRQCACVQSKFSYLATAYEVTQIAREMRQNTQADFGLLTDDGILDRETFPYVEPSSLEMKPSIDRERFHKIMAKLLAIPETMHLLRYKTEMLKMSQVLRQNREFLAHARAQQDESALESNAVVQAIQMYGKRNKWQRAESIESTAAVALSSLDYWREQIDNGVHWIEAYLSRERGKSVPLLCLPNEREGVLELAQRILPGFVFEILHVRTEVAHPPGAQDAHWIPLNQLNLALQEHKTVLVSRKAQEFFRRDLAVSPSVNWIALD